MKIKTIRVLTLLLFVVMSHAQVREEKLGFVAQLEAQEEQEYQAFINKIQTMSEAEYSIFLTERIEKAFQGKLGKKSVYIVVDVTDEMKQPKPGFFQNIFSSAPDPKQYGTKKVQGLLNTMNRTQTETSGNASAFIIKDQYQSLDKTRHFQRIEAVLSEQSARLLVTQPDIIDIHIIGLIKPGTEFVTIHTPTGRILPRKTQKIYDHQFIYDGFYNELMEKFKEYDVLEVEVSFKEPEGYEYTKEWNHKMELEVEIFLQSWPDYEFEVIYKDYSHVLLKTSKKHAQAMYKDGRVKGVRIGQFL